VPHQAASDIDLLPLHEILTRPDHSELQRLFTFQRKSGNLEAMEDSIHSSDIGGIFS